MNTTKLRRLDYIFLFTVLIGFYLLYRFSIFTSDDYYYSFIGGMSGGINGEYIPINSLTDAIRSNIYDYMHHNGRFIIHTITSFFCGVAGVDIFRVLNSIVFILLIAGIIKLIRSEL